MKKTTTIVIAAVATLMTWLSWVLAGLFILWVKPHPEDYEVGVSLFEWLSEPPYSWRLFLFSAAGFAFFTFACNWVASVRMRWRLPVAFLAMLIYAGMFAGLVVGVPTYYERCYIRYSLSLDENPTGELLQSKIRAMRTLVEKAGWPEKIEEINAAHLRGDAFDPMEYFTVLTNLSVRSGCVLDYVHVGGDNGSPVLYSRKQDEEPYRTEQEYLDTLPEGAWRPDGDYLCDWSDAIAVNDTEEAFLEYAALCLIGRQFYLCWHANYDDLKIIASRSKMEELLNHYEDMSFGDDFPMGYKLEARKLDVRPKVRMWPEMVEVTFLTFTKWGGFKDVTLHIGREYPNIVFEREEKIRVGYDCGVCY